VDWFSFTAKEISDIWPPCGYFSKDPLKETCYYLDVFLKGIPAGADYDLTVYAEDCAGTGGKFESKEPGQKEDAVFIGWSGTLVASDDMKFYVEVKPKVAGAFSCKTYTLAIDVYSICPDDPDTGKCPWELSE
ncbi:MAG: hypothetical protein FJ088_12415, partial [Deltaproteobacteria bacterium]|nr:hypothetical protein [Deltaproteobacteria bacterium]